MWSLASWDRKINSCQLFFILSPGVLFCVSKRGSKLRKIMSDCWGNEYTRFFCLQLTRSGYLLYAVFYLAIYSPSTDQLCRIQKSRCTYQKQLMLSISWQMNMSNINVWALCIHVAFSVGPGSPRTEMVEGDVWLHLGRYRKISSEIAHKLMKVEFNCNTWFCTSKFVHVMICLA